MVNLSYDQESQIQALLSRGMSQAAKALSQILKCEITFEPVRISLANYGQDLFIIAKEGVSAIIVTPLIGDLLGKSYLIANPYEVRCILEKSAVKLVNPDLTEAMLTEISNILSGAVITEMSNALSINIFGDVPELMSVHAEAVGERKHYIIPDTFLDIVCTTSFHYPANPDFSPGFIWKFSQRILSQLDVPVRQKA